MLPVAVLDIGVADRERTRRVRLALQPAQGDVAALDAGGVVAGGDRQQPRDNVACISPVADFEGEGVGVTVDLVHRPVEEVAGLDVGKRDLVAGTHRLAVEGQPAAARAARIRGGKGV